MLIWTKAVRTGDRASAGQLRALPMGSSKGLSQEMEAGGRTAIASEEPLSGAESGRVVETASRRLRKRAADRFWRDVRRRRMLAVADVIAAAIASLVAGASTPGALWALAVLPVWLVVAQVLGLYDRDQRSLRHLTIDEFGSIAAWAAVGVAIVGIVLPLTPAGPVGFGAIARAWLAATLASSLLRGAARWLWRQTTPPELTAVLGEGPLAAAARRKVELFGDMHLEVVSDRGLSLSSSNHDRAAWLHRLVHSLDRIVVATERIDPELIGQLAGICREEQVKLSVVSPLRGKAGAAPRLSDLADLPVLEYDTRDPSRSTRLLKRTFDIVFSALALVVTAPLLAIMAVAIKLDSPGPVFFSQRRAGKGGKPFLMYKLRTMTADAERALADVIVLEDLAEPMFKLRRDPRVTRVGRLLRRFSLDELPQLVNVLRGDMSIVGPRPEQVELVELYRPEHRFRLDLQPGMTGPMQVYGRGELNFGERLAVELDYVENLSFARDLRILFQTLPAVLRGTGAY
jgi:exopolysaccharide biosynthesis polyprenyl glycosylphosphotransferase